MEFDHMHKPAQYTEATLPELLGTAEERAGVRARCSDEEWAARVELAALIQALFLIGMDDQVYNHVTLEIPGTDGHILTQPYGLMFSEVTASALIRINLDSEIITSGSTKLPLNLPGALLHTSIHRARADIRCIIHSHEAHILAVASSSCGLVGRLWQGAAMIVGGKAGGPARHPYAGIVIAEAERTSLPADLGTKDKLMLLDNHGMVVCGESAAEAFSLARALQRAARIQCLVLAMAPCMVPTEEAEYTGAGDMDPPRTILMPSETAESTYEMFTSMMKRAGPGHLEFEAVKRRLKALGVILHTI